MASPYPVGDFHLPFFASFPGALRTGSKPEKLSASICFPLFCEEQTSLPDVGSALLKRERNGNLRAAICNIS